MRYAVFILLLICTQAGKAQSLPAFEGKDTGAMIKASYLYNFSKLIDWPTEHKTGNFVISVMGGGNLHQELVKRYNDKQVGSQQIEIRKIAKTLNISDCHVLYIGSEFSDFLPEVVKALEKRPTLIVSDADQGLAKGAALNFVVDETQLKFELNIKNATNRDLFIGSTIRSLATKVE